jgi:hypothetical protein
MLAPDATPGDDRDGADLAYDGADLAYDGAFIVLRTPPDPVGVLWVLLCGFARRKTTQWF